MVLAWLALLLTFALAMASAALLAGWLRPPRASGLSAEEAGARLLDWSGVIATGLFLIGLNLVLLVPSSP